MIRNALETKEEMRKFYLEGYENFEAICFLHVASINFSDAL